jgi:hypothetical protein
MVESEDLIADYSYYLSVCPPDRAVEWMKNRKYPTHFYRNSLLHSILDPLEQILIAREDDYIDYGLARYSFTLSTARAIYNRGKPNLNHVLLRHFPFCGVDILGDWKGKFSSPAENKIRELKCLLGNPLIGDSILEKYLSRESHFEHIQDSDYIKMMVILGSNSRLQRKCERGSSDGWDEFRYGEVFTAAWKLTLTVPPTQEWAEGIYYLLQKAQPPQCQFDIQSALDRWQIDAQNVDNDPYHFYGYSLNVRSRIADLIILSIDMVKSDDLAIRQSYYRRLDPYKDSAWLPYMELDGRDFINSIVFNENVWKTGKGRDLLGEICWQFPDPNASMDIRNLYNDLYKLNEKSHPDSFIQDVDD